MIRQGLYAKCSDPYIGQPKAIFRRASFLNPTPEAIIFMKPPNLHTLKPKVGCFRNPRRISLISHDLQTQLVSAEVSLCRYFRPKAQKPNSRMSPRPAHHHFTQLTWEPQESAEVCQEVCSLCLYVWAGSTGIGFTVSWSWYMCFRCTKSCWLCEPV